MPEDEPLPPGLAEKVNPHLEKTLGVIIAAQDPCLAMANDEAKGGRVPGRGFATFKLPSLAAWAPPKSWVLGVLICPGEDANPILEWVQTAKVKDVERIRFYLYPGVDESKAMRPWTRAGLPYRARVVQTWTQLHKAFGRQHAFWVLRDHEPNASYVA